MNVRNLARLVIPLLLLALLGTGCSIPRWPWWGRPAGAEIDWYDFLKVQGITYVSGFDPQATPLTEDALGPIHSYTRFRLADNVTDPNYQTKDGDAAFLEPNTPIYTLKGYDPQFRLAVRVGNTIKLYESNTNLAAKTGADLLDLQGKVSAITVGTWADGHTLATIQERERVEELVAAILSAPVTPPTARPAATRSDKRYMLTFRFTDGTSTTRAFWPELNLLLAGSGLRLPDSVAKAVAAAVAANQPAP